MNGNIRIELSISKKLLEKIAFKALQTSVESVPYVLPFSSSKLSKGSSVTISIFLAKSWILQNPFSIVACKLLIN